MSAWVWIALACLVFVVPYDALAEDVVYLRDGRELRGEIIRDIEGESWIIVEIVLAGGITRTEVVLRTDIERIDLDAVGSGSASGVDGGDDEDGDVEDGTEAGDGSSEEDDIASPTIPPTVGKIAFIRLGETETNKDMVGPYVNQDALERSVDYLKDLPEEEQPDVVVLIMDSGGGALVEISLLTEYIHFHMKPYFRTVMWIESAISAAAMTAWAVEEIYMMPPGHIGACTGFFSDPSNQGRLTAVKGGELNGVLFMMQEISRWGDHPYEVMWAMQVSGDPTEPSTWWWEDENEEPNRPLALTAKVDDYGDVDWRMWFGSDVGFAEENDAVLVSSSREILTLDAAQSVKWDIAQGIAKSKDELAELLGFSEWRQVADGANQIQTDHRDCYFESTLTFNRHYDAFFEHLGRAQVAAASGDIGICRKQVSDAAIRLRRIEEMDTDCQDAIDFYIFGGNRKIWFDDLESLIDQAGEACQPR
ncbi:MAG: hypothetical protein AAGI30_06720 [Planctomycetota bacterium]